MSAQEQVVVEDQACEFALQLKKQQQAYLANPMPSADERIARLKRLRKSLLDQIQGIGKQRKRSLLNHFGSARSVESASFEELKSVEGIEDNIAKKIYYYFHE